MPYPAPDLLGLPLCHPLACTVQSYRSALRSSHAVVELAPEVAESDRSPPPFRRDGAPFEFDSIEVDYWIDEFVEPCSRRSPGTGKSPLATNKIELRPPCGGSK
jgi:hypothetical protein